MTKKYKKTDNPFRVDLTTVLTSVTISYRLFTIRIDRLYNLVFQTVSLFWSGGNLVSTKKAWKRGWGGE